MNEQPVRSVETDALQIAYVEHGPADGWPVILSHGFPYDVHAFDEVAPILAREGARVIAPYTRGFGPTRFVSDALMRNGQQAAPAATSPSLPTRSVWNARSSVVSIGEATRRARRQRCGRNGLAASYPMRATTSSM